MGNADLGDYIKTFCTAFSSVLFEQPSQEHSCEKRKSCFATIIVCTKHFRHNILNLKIRRQGGNLKDHGVPSQSKTCCDFPVSVAILKQWGIWLLARGYLPLHTSPSDKMVAQEIATIYSQQTMQPFLTLFQKLERISFHYGENVLLCFFAMYRTQKATTVSMFKIC